MYTMWKGTGTMVFADQKKFAEIRNFLKEVFLLVVLVGAINFIISWLAFLSFSNKKKFPVYVPTCYIGIILALYTDLWILVYPLWDYPGTEAETFFIQLLNAFGLYFVVNFFFLQSLPQKQTVLSVTLHIFYWSILVIILEMLYLYIGFIKHGLWWNIGFSYAADWILFVTFYLHHKWILRYSLINVS